MQFAGRPPDYVVHGEQYGTAGLAQRCHSGRSSVGSAGKAECVALVLAVFLLLRTSLLHLKRHQYCNSVKRQGL